MNFFFRPKRILATLATCVILSSCDLFNDKVLVGALIQTPEIFVSAKELLQGQNIAPPQGFTLPDGGMIPSGAQLPPGHTVPADAGVTIPAKVIGFAYFGTSPDFSMKLRGLEDSQVKVDIGGGNTLDYQSNGNGIFAVVPSANGTAVNLVGPNISFTGRYKNEDFTVRVDGMGGQERIDAFHPEGFVIRHKVGDDFLIQRPPSPGKERALGFVTVIPVDAEGHIGNPTYNNLPQTPNEYISIVGAPNHWRQSTVKIPAAAFPDVDAYYLVLFQSVKLGPAVTPNLFTLSVGAAGMGDIGFVKTE